MASEYIFCLILCFLSLIELPTTLPLGMFPEWRRGSGGMNGDSKWPAGGAAEFADSSASRYLTLGGQLHDNSAVEKILVEQDRGVGVRPGDGLAGPQRQPGQGHHPSMVKRGWYRCRGAAPARSNQIDQL